VDARAYGPELEAEDVGDLLVGQALDVAEHHGGAEVRGKGGERRLHVVVEEAVEHLRVGGDRAAGDPAVRVVRERVEADLRLAAGLVEEEVRGDPVQPALEGARGVGGQGPEDPDEDLLGEVLRIVRVARQPVGQPVDASGVLGDDLVPRRGLPLGLRVRDRLGRAIS
jgi:hypothetical protein